MKKLRAIFCLIIMLISTTFTFSVTLNGNDRKISVEAENFNKNYKMKNKIQYEKNMVYNISYPIFENTVINQKITSNINDIVNEFKNDFNPYNPQILPNKLYLYLKTEIGFFGNNIMFLKFDISRSFEEYPNPINYYQTYIFNLSDLSKIEKSEFFDKGYLDLFSKYAKNYYKYTYGLKIGLNSENYNYIAPVYENFTTFFIKDDFLELNLYDYKIDQDILIKINLNEVLPFIKNKFKTNYKEPVTVLNKIESTTVPNKIESTTVPNKIEPTTVPETVVVSSSKSIVEPTTVLKISETTSKLPNVIDPNKPMIALTFDDGPNKEVTNKILNILEKNNARATFFVVGRNLEKNKETLKRMLSLNCQIGNHTQNHKNLTYLTKNQIIKEVSSTDEMLVKYTGKKADLVRVPFGSYNETVKSSIKSPLIMWNVDTKDWQTKNTKLIVQEIRNKAKDGNIVLMHDLYNATAEAANIIIPELIKKGFQLVTIEELFSAKKIPLENGKIYFNAIKKKEK